jgi:hypothetical protein
MASKSYLFSKHRKRQTDDSVWLLPLLCVGAAAAPESPRKLLSRVRRGQQPPYGEQFSRVKSGFAHP